MRPFKIDPNKIPEKSITGKKALAITDGGAQGFIYGFAPVVALLAEAPITGGIFTMVLCSTTASGAVAGTLVSAKKKAWHVNSANQCVRGIKSHLAVRRRLENMIEKHLKNGKMPQDKWEERLYELFGYAKVLETHLTVFDRETEQPINTPLKWVIGKRENGQRIEVDSCGQPIIEKPAAPQMKFKPFGY